MFNILNTKKKKKGKDKKNIVVVQCNPPEAATSIDSGEMSTDTTTSNGRQRPTVFNCDITTTTSTAVASSTNSGEWTAHTELLTTTDVLRLDGDASSSTIDATAEVEVPRVTVIRKVGLKRNASVSIAPKVSSCFHCFY